MKQETNQEMKLVKKKSVMGRPSAYRDEYAAQAMKLCKLGATNPDLADFFEVSVCTLNNWKRAHPGFRKQVSIGKLHADAEIADRLFQLARGYSHVATKFASYKGRITDSKEYVKHYPPDAQSCIFWLKNRRPDLWREKVGIDIVRPEGAPIRTVDENFITLEAEKLFLRKFESRAKLLQQPNDPA